MAKSRYPFRAKPDPDPSVPPGPGDGIVWAASEGETCTTGELKRFLENMPDDHTIHLYHGQAEIGIYVSAVPVGT